MDKHTCNCYTRQNGQSTKYGKPALRSFLDLHVPRAKHVYIITEDLHVGYKFTRLFALRSLVNCFFTRIMCHLYDV